MDYKAYYDRLMERGQGRLLEGYTERHHIIPRCIGGDDSQKNLVRLTAEEHYVAHQLLVKIYPGNIHLVRAANMMTVGSKQHKRVNNKLYGWLRRQYAELLSEEMKGHEVSQKTRDLISKANKGRKLGPMSEESRKKKSIALSGRKFSEKHKRNLSRAKKGKSSNRKGVKLSVKIRKTMSENSNPWNKGLVGAYKHSEQSRLKISKSKLGNPSVLSGVDQSLITCHHCDKTGGISAMKRWHFDNCKFITEGITQNVLD